MKTSDDQVVELFFNVAKTIRKIPENHDFSFSPYIGQYRCLLRLEEHGAMSQKELAQILDIRPPSLSELLLKLESKGYIKRTPSSTDKRILLVSLTDQGYEQIAEYNRRKEETHMEMLSALSEEEKQQFYHILSKILSNYKKEDES